MLDDPVLTRFKADVVDMYGERLERVMQFGSRARGDQTGDSDYDFAVFVAHMDDYWSEKQRLSDTGFDILMDASQVVNAIPFASGSLVQRTPLMFEISMDGVDIEIDIRRNLNDCSPGEQDCFHHRRGPGDWAGYGAGLCGGGGAGDRDRSE